jgi:hypothetical protein
VSSLCYDQEGVNQYREAALKHREVLRTAEERMDAAIENGDKAEAEKALAEATASGEAFRELRSKLKPTDLFVAKYNIQVHGPHEVSFVLPRGVSRYEMLCEAQELVAERDGRALVDSDDLKRWGDDARFTASCESPERIRIDGHVEGGDANTALQRAKLLAGKGLEQAKLEDLGAAFVANYVATGRDLFEGRFVNAVGGALGFPSFGLHVRDIYDAYGDTYDVLGNSIVAVASRVRSPFAKASGDRPESKKLRSWFSGFRLR